MTLIQLYHHARQILKKSGISDFACDTELLMKACFHLDRAALAIRGSEPAPSESERDFMQKVARRAEGIPLQYIIGKWTFMGRDFWVGDGVLVPREDTEVVTRDCLKRLEALENPRIIDLCSGSGAIAVTIASERPDAEVYALELSEAAFYYLERNTKLNNTPNVRPILGDVFSKHRDIEDGFFDAVVSNPPYICSGEIPSLSREVLNEPHIALDGGSDGADFYREIIKNWTAKIKHSGSLSFELDPDQAAYVSDLMREANFDDIRTLKDIDGMNRAVSGRLC